MMIFTVFALSFVFANSPYEDCQYPFKAAKKICGQKYNYSGTKHGQCIDWAVRDFDYCIAQADKINQNAYNDHGGEYEHSNDEYYDDYDQYKPKPKVNQEDDYNSKHKSGK
jgi:hypothetical protein